MDNKIKCSFCGEDFVKTGKRKYCSKECAYESNQKLNKDIVKTGKYKEKKKKSYEKWYKENGRNRADNYKDAIIEWQLNHPVEFNAHRKVNYAIRTGELIKPEKCEMCGEVKRLCGHHEDYSKPLDVKWLCYSCHKIIHKE